MNYITTNIRIPEEDYLRLKLEAAQDRKSLGAVIRNKLKFSYVFPENQVAELLAETRKIAKTNSKYLKNINGVTIIREMRDNSKW